MTVDPTEPETFATRRSAPGESHPEVPEADAAEQRADLLPGEDDPQPLRSTGTPPIDPADAVNETDAAEQAQVVEINEDDYR
ncbi:hypothetical protein QNO07_23170 [Streptomyces sp. 549]|uniref:hypothetical protein n=1 Tax=Streptomyces sp. 549 TaxID=3049076 RepID=UPI0024C2EC6C|nr:hypothetical protein [Streptomyces sp. 549]MDK1476285.1 hypothetical protein [Streptomyces sp. 549]